MIDSATAPATSATPSGTKICIHCGTDQPIHRFRFIYRKTGIRVNQCNDCHNAYMREYCAKKREKGIRTFVREAPRGNSYAVTNALVANMIKRFGGVGRFADAWMTAIDARIKTKPGSKALLDSFRTLLHLMQIADAGAPKKETIPDDVSAEDLARVIREAMEAVQDESDGK